MASRSRWLVGSSSSSRSEGAISARASANRIRQPPEKLSTGSDHCSGVKPKPAKSCSARDTAVQASASINSASSSAMREPCSCAWASLVCAVSSISARWACSWRKCTSPSITNSRAASLLSAISCLTLAMRQPAGKSRRPASASISCWIKANKVDLPAPFLPTKPTRSPG